MTKRDMRLHDDCADSSWRGHKFRYHLAAGFCQPGDVVVDAACGSGYGMPLLGNIEYVGVDNDPAINPVVEADLEQWVPDFPFDVFVGFETIEHLPNYDAYVRAAKQARKWIVMSVPVVPTTHLNPFHCHNFAPGELASMFVGGEWVFYQAVLQPAELSEIYVFARVGDSAPAP